MIIDSFLLIFNSSIFFENFKSFIVYFFEYAIALLQGIVQGVVVQIIIDVLLLLKIGNLTYIDFEVLS